LCHGSKQHLARRDAIAQDRRNQLENTRRLVAGLRAEINAAMASAEREGTAATVMLANLAHARIAAVPIKDPKPPAPELLVITDAIIYRQLAQDLGRLPPVLIEQVINFYTAALDIPRVAAIGDTASGCYEVMRDLAPRLKRNGRVVLAMLDNFEKSNFAPDADLTLTPEQARDIEQSQRR
jgi:hypothetical protein